MRSFVTTAPSLTVYSRHNKLSLLQPAKSTALRGPAECDIPALYNSKIRFGILAKYHHQKPCTVSVLPVCSCVFGGGGGGGGGGQ